MDQVPHELTAILQEIDKALSAKLYYLAIAVALSVPDICASLEFDPANPKRAGMDTYSAWCDLYIGDQFKNLSGEDIYRLRCGVLHFGHFGHSKAKFNRVIFMGSESSLKAHDVVATVNPGVTFGGQSAEDLRLAGQILHLDVVRFCQTITKAARDWSIAKSNDAFVQNNLQNLVYFRPKGLPPFLVGFPVIA